MKLAWMGDVHFELSTCMMQMFHALNIEVCIPSSEYQVTHWPDTRRWVWGEQWTKEYAKKHLKFNNALILKKQEIIDWKPDCVVITCYESQFEVIHELLPKLPKSTKVIWFSGNNYPSGFYPWYRISNYLPADLPSFELCKKHAIANYYHFKPWIDYEKFSFTGDSTEMMVASHIGDFESNFPDCYKFAKHLESQNPEVKYEIHSKSSRDEVCDAMGRSIATLHIKPSDGFGYSIVQSMGKGRPVFAHRELAKNCSYKEWLVEGETGFWVSSAEEYRAKLLALVRCPEYRSYVQKNCAVKIRQYINNAEQTEKLEKFLENLQ